MRLTLTQLEGFVTVAEELHFGRAAQRLNMTQPPLTRQIQALERSLQVQLFDRGTRGISLTTAGQAFLIEARRVLALVSAAPDAARRVAAGETGTLRLAFTTIGAYAVLADVLSVISENLPRVTVSLSEQVSPDQFAGLEVGSLDLGLARPPVPPHLASRLIHIEDLVLAVPSTHEIAHSTGPVRVSEVAADYIGYTPEGSHCLHNICAALVGVETMLQAQIVSQFPTMLALVAAGRGFALIPRSCSAIELSGVSYVELHPDDASSVSLYACWDPESVSPILRKLIPHLPEIPDRASETAPSAGN